MVDEKAEKISKYGWFAIFGVGIALITDGMDFMSLSLALPQIMKEFNVSHMKGGALGTYTMLGMAAGSILAGWTSDRFGRVRTLLFCTAAFTVFTTAIGFVTQYWHVAVLRLLSGAGISAAYIIGTVVVGEYVPTKVRGTVIGTIVAGYSAGFAVAALLSSYVVPTIGWRGLFYIALIPGSISFILCMKIPEPPSWVADKALVDSKKVAKPNEFAIMWADKSIRKNTILWIITAFMSCSAYYGANTWLPTYVTKELGVNLKQMGFFMAGSYICTVAGKIIAGKMSDIYGRRIVWVLCGIATAAFMPVLVYFATKQSIAYLLLAFGLLYGTQFGIVSTYLQECFPTNVRGTASAFSYNVGRGLASVAPLALGWVAGMYSIGMGMALLGVFFLLDAILPALFIKDRMYDPSAVVKAPVAVTVAGENDK